MNPDPKAIEWLILFGIGFFALLICGGRVTLASLQLRSSGNRMRKILPERARSIMDSHRGYSLINELRQANLGEAVERQIEIFNASIKKFVFWMRMFVVRMVLLITPIIFFKFF